MVSADSAAAAEEDGAVDAAASAEVDCGGARATTASSRALLEERVRRCRQSGALPLVAEERVLPLWAAVVVVVVPGPMAVVAPNPWWMRR